MRPSFRSTLLSRVFALTVLASGLHAGTYVVDAAGGGDFTDIPAAIAAASSGDVLLVRPGSYSAFRLDKALIVLGQGPGVLVYGSMSDPYVRIEGITAGAVAVVADIELSDLGTSITDGILVDGCTIPIVIDAPQHGPGTRTLSVIGSTDVRVRAANDFRIEVVDARLELAESTLWGLSGADGSPWIPDGQDGGPAVRVSGLSGLHLARSSAQGGNGGYPYDTFGYYGAGGAGVEVEAGAFALVAGQAAHLIGGGVNAWNGSVAAGLFDFGVARISGVSTTGWSGPGFLEEPAPPDPTLSILGAPHGGQVTTFRVHAEPGSIVDLRLGRNATIVDSPGYAEDILVTPNRVFHLGIVPASGVIGFNFPVPSILPQGFTFFAQAKATLPSNEVRYTNSVPLVVR